MQLMQGILLPYAHARILDLSEGFTPVVPEYKKGLAGYPMPSPDWQVTLLVFDFASFIILMTLRVYILRGNSHLCACEVYDTCSGIGEWYEYSYRLLWPADSCGCCALLRPVSDAHVAVRHFL